MYRFLEYQPSDRLPSACELYTKAIVLYARASKIFALPGLRIGWLITHDATILQKCRFWKDYTTICCSAPSEILAIIALQAKDKDHFTQSSIDTREHRCF
jgi:aspartate/methionine/tyrosine aminotransferase